MILAETAPQIMHKELFKHIILLIGPLSELMTTVKDDDDWDTQNDPYDIDLERYYYFYWQLISYCAF